MVNAFKPTITAILALCAAAPILAAPLKSRVDSGFSSVNNRAPIPPPTTQPPVTGPETVPALALASAPEAAAKETSSDVGHAVLNPHLATRGVEVEAGAKRGTARFEGSLHSPIAQGLLGRAVLTAISSNLRREPEFANALSRELATELEARSAISRAITGGGAGFAVPNGLTQHLNRAGGTPAESASASWEVEEPDWGEGTQSSTKLLSSLSGIGTGPKTAPNSWAATSAAKSQSPSTPDQSPSFSWTGSTLESLAGSSAGARMMQNIAASWSPVGKTSRDLDADTLHLLGRNLEDLFARSFGLNERD